jgi:hypothetical protein
MYIEAVNNINFGFKPVALTDGALKNARELADKINKSESVIQYTENKYMCTRIGYVTVADDVYFFNNDKNSEMFLGKNKISINRETGDVKIVEKSFFKSAKRLFRQVGKYLEYLNKNFESRLAVGKRYIREDIEVDRKENKAYVVERSWI